MIESETDIFNFGNLLKDVFNLGIDTNKFTVTGIMYTIFIWYFIWSCIVHSGCAIFALITLKRHKYARFYSIVLFLMGFVGPLTNGIITSCLIALVFKFYNIHMKQWYVFLCGLAQAALIVFISVCKFPLTM